jgi:hypothetical protein
MLQIVKRGYISGSAAGEPPRHDCEHATRHLRRGPPTLHPKTPASAEDKYFDAHPHPAIVGRAEGTDPRSPRGTEEVRASVVLCRGKTTRDPEIPVPPERIG